MPDGDFHDMRVAVYRRQSSKKQEHSIEDQKKSIDTVVERIGVRVVEEYEEKRSGATLDERVELQRMLEDAKSGAFEMVLVYDLSRLTRGGIAVFFGIWNDLQRAGVDIYDCKLDRIVEEGDWPLICSEVAQAKEENTKRSRDTSRGILYSVRDRRSDPGRSIYGYDRLYLNESGDPYQLVRRNADGSKLILDPETREVRDHLDANTRYPKVRSHRAVLVPGDDEHVAVVRRIFTMAGQGRSPTAVADALNREAVPGPRGGKWSSNTIRDMLSNRAYAGDTVFNKRQEGRYHEISRDGPMALQNSFGEKTLRVKDEDEWICHLDSHEPLVSREEFDTVQRTVTARKKRSSGTGRSKKRTYLLSGMAFCARCGARLSGQSSTSSRKKGSISSIRYVCSSARKHGASVCGHYSINAEKLENAALDRIREHLFSDEMKQAMREELAREIASYGRREDALSRIRKERKRIVWKRKGLFTKLSGDEIDFLKDQIEEMMERDKQLAEEEREIERSGVPDPTDVEERCMRLFEELEEELDDSCAEAIKTILLDLGLQVVYDPDGKEVRIWFDPFENGQPSATPA